MLRYLALAILSVASLFARRPTGEDRAAISSVTWGRIAFCKESTVDELQVIGEPRTLSKGEAQKLGGLFGAESSYLKRMPDGSYRGSVAMCIPYWNFKIILHEPVKGTFVTIRFCTSCRQVALKLDGEWIKLDNVQDAGFQEMTKLFDDWFPGWKKISENNKRQRENEARKARESASP
jgi:hypothetical protein